MIALVFLYFCAWIFIFGGELNAALSRAKLDVRRATDPQSPAGPGTLAYAIWRLRGI